MNAQDLKNLAEAYTQLSTKKDDSYLETDMKKRQKNNEKARKDMEKMGTMKNPHFGEEVKGQDTEMRKASAADRKAGYKKLSPSEGKANADKMRRDIKFYDKLTKEGLDPVGKEDGDVNNDGKKNSTDKYLMKRRAAIGKAMGKKKMSEGVRDVDPEKGTAERKARLEIKRGMKMDDHPQYNKKKTEQYESNPRKVEDPRQAQEGFKGKHGQFDEAITSEKGKAKMKSMIDARTTDSGKAKKGKGQNVKDIQHIGRANVDGYGGTPSNLKVAKNPVKSNFTGLNSGTGNKAKRRADALTKNEELELSGKFTAEEIEKILEIMGE